jgi:hypothetical protein
MLNLIIQTQYKENYAAHNEDYEHGVSEPYWKFKGGSSYLITDIDFINTEYLEGLVEETAFIHSYENPASMEYVLDWELIDEENLSDHIEEWETPYLLEKNEKGQWTSKRVTENGDYCYMSLVGQEMLRVIMLSISWWMEVNVYPMKLSDNGSKQENWLHKTLDSACHLMVYYVYNEERR